MSLAEFHCDDPDCGQFWDTEEWDAEYCPYCSEPGVLISITENH